ncbi:MAG: PTS N-acetylgalactosamine transporter subunit IIC, partial [Enterobacterales bacterium]|nr:PTS N-acetylgalactosamine transporter subunit IIC [Enterobacterales bacterium]
IMTTVIAHSTGVDAKTAIGLGLPFSFLMQYIILFYYSAFSFFMQKADRYAEEGNTRSLGRLNLLMTSIVAVTYAVVTFLCAYVSQGAMQTLVQSMPAWLTHGFEVAGGVLPAVGFGLLLKVMMKTPFIPFFIVGFLFVTFIPVQNLLPVAVLGAAFAVYEYFNEQKKAAVTAVKAEDMEDGI